MKLQTLLFFCACCLVASNAHCDIIQVAQDAIVSAEVDANGNPTSLRFGDDPSNTPNAPGNTLFNTENGPVGNSGPNVDNSWRYAVRERQNSNQRDRRVATFLAFDVSTLNAQEVNSPNFSANFTIDYAGRLNQIDANDGVDALLGAVVDGTFGVTTSSLPSFASATNSQFAGTVVRNIDEVLGPVTDVTVDITAIVQDWFNGVLDNRGLVLYAGVEPGTVFENNLNNAAYFGNARIVTATTAIPEPSSISLIGLGLLGLFVPRKRAARYNT